MPFSPEAFPVFADLDLGWYGFPLVNGVVKISNHLPGVVTEVGVEHGVSHAFTEAGLQFCREYIPALADAEVVNTGTCYYAMTPHEDFIIDQVRDTAFVACGFSGHGFKFVPVVGTLVADMMLGKAVDAKFNRFKVAGRNATGIGEK